jgi:hypothetical protein
VNEDLFGSSVLAPRRTSRYRRRAPLERPRRHESLAGDGICQPPGPKRRNSPEYREQFAQIDLEDVLAADCVVSFTEPPAAKCRDCDGIGVVYWPAEDGGSPPMECPGCGGKGRIDSGRGGRHVEFGAAVATGKRLIVVGHRENLFHHLPGVEFFDGPKWLDAI